LVRDEEDTLILKSEEPLHGSCAYGILDYCIYARDAVILVHEAKNEQFNKGVAQHGIKYRITDTVRIGIGDTKLTENILCRCSVLWK